MNIPPLSLCLLIVDDEQLARTELCRKILALLPCVTAIEADNVAHAREILLRNQVDGIFLDLEMPGVHGLEFLPELRQMGVPVVITTAHENFALRAFDGDAADYLLKPIEDTRLARSLSRMLRPEKPAKGRLVVVGDQSNCWPLLPEEIVMAEADGNYVMIHLRDRSPILLSRSLKEIEPLLDPVEFIRVNRSQIVRLEYLKRIRRGAGGTFVAELTGHGSIEFSRRQARAFRLRFGF